MANNIDSQILHDGDTNVVLKYTGDFDTDITGVTLIDAATLHAAALSGQPTKLRMMSLNYILTDSFSAVLTWDGATPTTLAEIYGRGSIPEDPRYQGFITDATTPTGKILISTSGAAVSPRGRITLTLQFRKQFT